MPLKDAIKVTRKTFFNPVGWFGYNLFQSQIQTTVDLARGIFVAARAKRTETFAQAVARLGLVEADIVRIHRNFLLYAVFFLLTGVSVFAWGIWLLVHHHTFSGLLLGIASSGLAFVMAFRYHFLAFQIKHRKLGCSFDEWLSGRVRGDGGPSP